MITVHDYKPFYNAHSRLSPRIVMRGRPYLPVFGLIQDRYTLAQLLELIDILSKKGVFDFEQFDSGAFPAVGEGSRNPLTSGYRAAWTRDNIHIAYAHHVCGDTAAGKRALACLCRFYSDNRSALREVIEGRADPAVPMNRPHVRFDGVYGTRIAEKWPHAQNDALGYFLWFFCILIAARQIDVSADDGRLLTDFVRYFEAIRYWEDEDSGHWEEQRKISASSIGVVVAALSAVRNVLPPPLFVRFTEDVAETIDTLIDRGRAALNRILPAECVQSAAVKRRRFDSALLFLIDPLEVVTKRQADHILDDVKSELQGEIGISRYPMDSYWGPDYRRLPPEKRTVDLSEDIIRRSDFSFAGSEANWCIFDSVLSIIYGKRYVEEGTSEYLRLQTRYFNRAVRQLFPGATDTEKWHLPEAYFLENGRYVPNDHIPLQWAHANLWRAAAAMITSHRISEASHRGWV